jgi:hypothetical protein
VFTAVALISDARALRSSRVEEYKGERSMTGISDAVQSRGGVFNTSRYTGPYAVRSSSFVVEGGCVVIVDIAGEFLSSAINPSYFVV